MSLDRFAQRLWYGRGLSLLSVLLLPLSGLFAVAIYLRRQAYRMRLFSSIRVDRPVIVVGNITVGGTGKTPLVHWIAEECARRDVRAAIICRGYGGQSGDTPMVVSADSDARVAGDEAVLLAQSFRGVVIACADRVAAARRAIELGAELVVCDDGLQHYRLQRDCEVVVIDAARGWGNGRLLPAGPLREPVSRVREAQLLVCTWRGDRGACMLPPAMRRIDIRMQLGAAVSLQSGEMRPLDSFRNTPVHALAGIGNPEGFFSLLQAHGITMDTRALPDHAAIDARDLDFGERIRCS